MPTSKPFHAQASSQESKTWYTNVGEICGMACIFNHQMQQI
jgi:hypothetical protein